MGFYLNKIIPAIRSRCLSVRVASPTEAQIIEILNEIFTKEGLELPSKLADRIAKKSNRNLRRPILMCETCRVAQRPLSEDQAVMEPDWEVYVPETASMMINEQTAKQVMDIRKRLYELLAICIPADVIMKGLYNELAYNCDGSLKFELTQIAADYEHKARLGQKSIYHLEAFVVKFMCTYRQFLQDGFDVMMDKQLSHVLGKSSVVSRLSSYLPSNCCCSCC